MLIVCPTCSTAYQIGPTALGAGRPLGALLALQEYLVRDARKASLEEAVRPPPRRPPPFALRLRRAKAPLRPRRRNSTSRPQAILGRRRDAAGRSAAAKPAKALAAMDAPPLAPGRRGRAAEPSESKFDPGAARGHRDHRGAARPPCPRGTQGQAHPAAADPQPADADRRAGGDPARCAAMARDGGAAFPANRLAVLACWGCRSICAA